MSLQVWLPLNERFTTNFNNQGISNIKFSSAAYDISKSEGKIGGHSYYFGSYNTRILSNSSSQVTLNNQFTISFWIKVISWSNWGRIFCLYSSSKNEKIQSCLNTSENGTIGTQLHLNGASVQDSYGGNLSDLEWHHFTLVVDKTIKKHYLDGVLMGQWGTTQIVSSDYNIMIGGNIDNGAYPNVCLNDFRIYDHALSIKEIKEISKGLIIHYPLDNNGSVPYNILNNSNDLSKWTKEAGITCEYDNTTNMYKITDSSHTSSRWGIYQDITILANTTYTITCTIKGESCGVGFGFYDTTPGTFPPTIINVTNNDGYIRKTYTATSGTSSTICRIYLLTNCATSKIAYFEKPKLEINSISTPWIPNSSDIEYSLLKYDTTIEYDISGYKNNGIRYGTITQENDTPRYYISTKYNGSSCIIKTQPINISNGYGDIFNTWSYGIWYKSNNLSSGWQAIVLLNSDGADADTQLGFWTCHNKNRLQSSANGNFNSMINLPHDTNWHHYFCTYDGSTMKTYLDGTLVDTTTINNALLRRPNLVIGARSTNFNGNKFDNYFTGQLSDFRLYTTVISADDIKDLYQTSASIANNGTMFGYDFNEE